MTKTRLSPDTIRILRHLVATIAFRSSRSLRDAPDGFAEIRLTETGMTAGELVLHMTNVLAFAFATVTGTDRIRHEALPWQQEIDRFYSLLSNLDARLVAGIELENGMDLRLMQGPFADALTHIGQLHAMRRKAGAPVASTNYVRADIQIGRVTLDHLTD